MEAARIATAADEPRVLALARLARAEAAEKRGGALYLAREARGEPLEESLTPDPRPEGEVLVVGTVDDVVIGYALLVDELLRSGERLAVVEEVFVEPEARSIGVGEAMMDEIVRFAEARGCIGIDAFALPGDRQTKNFFETFGLVARGIVVHRSLRDAE